MITLRRRYKLKSAKPQRIKKPLPRMLVFLAKCIVFTLPILALPILLIALPLVFFGAFLILLTIILMQMISEVKG